VFYCFFCSLYMMTCAFCHCLIKTWWWWCSSYDQKSSVSFSDTLYTCADWLRRQLHHVNFVSDTLVCYSICPGWIWRPSPGRRMINKVASTFQVDRRVQCMANCTVSPVCDSYNYHAADKTCQFNTHDTPLLANSADIVTDSAWDWFSSSFTVVAWTP